MSWKKKVGGLFWRPGEGGEAGEGAEKAEKLPTPAPTPVAAPKPAPAVNPLAETVAAPAPARVTVTQSAVDDELANIIAGNAAPPPTSTSSAMVRGDATPAWKAGAAAEISAFPAAVTPDDDIIEDFAAVADADDAQRLAEFIQDLDPDIPQSAKVATASAFLKSGLKTDVKTVIGNAEAKIARLRGNLTQRDGEIRAEMATLEATIQQLVSQQADLQTQLDALAQVTKDDEDRVLSLKQFFGIP